MTGHTFFKLNAQAALAAVAVLATSTATQAIPVPIPGLKPTGVSSGAIYTTLPTGVADPHYRLIQAIDGSGPNAFVTSPRPTSWVPNQPLSQWISPDGTNTPLLSGLYVYQFQFDLTGFDPSTASITGSWTADDSSRVVLNGNFGAGVVQSTTFAAFDTFTFNTGFVPGINTLDFRIGNAFFPGISLGGPSGLHVNRITGTAELIPEPASIALFGSGALFILKRNKKQH